MKYSLLLFLLVVTACQFVRGQIPWPVPAPDETNPQPVLGTLGELRKPPLSSAPHLHNGVDVGGPKGTDVFAVGAGCVGQVVHRGGRLESVRIGDFTYVHVAVSTQLKQGACIGVGTLVGQTNSANHVHLIRHGAGGIKLNALLLLQNYSDLQPPATPTGVALFDNQGVLFPQLNSGDSVLTSPDVSIKVEAGDIEGSNTLGVFELCASLTDTSGTAAGPGEVCHLLFQSLSANADVNAVYDVSSSTVQTGNFHLIYNVTNFDNSQGSLDTSSLGPGRYKLTVAAKDIESATTSATTVLKGPDSEPIFVIKPATLALTTSGTGSGSITLAPTPSFTCGPNCYQIVDFVNPITLIAQPGPNSIFTGWSGDCAGTSASVSIVVAKNTSCIANFQAAPAGLTISVTLAGGGTGNVQSFPSGINCGGGGTVCTASFPFGPGAEVALFTSPATGSFLESWTGCSIVDNGFCIVQVQSNTQNAQITATFLQSALAITSVNCNAIPGASFTNVHIVITAQATGGVGFWVTDAGTNQTSEACGAWSGPTGAFGISCTRSSGQPAQSTFQLTEDHPVFGTFPFPHPVTFPTQVFLSTAVPIPFPSPLTLLVSGPSCTIP